MGFKGLHGDFMEIDSVGKVKRGHRPATCYKLVLDLWSSHFEALSH